MLIPLSLVLRSLIIRQDIPYIRALRIVPRDIKDKLPPEFVAILDIHVSITNFCLLCKCGGEVADLSTKQIPKIEFLHRGIRDMALFYHRKFGITLPPLNSPIILYRHIKRLAIPST